MKLADLLPKTNAPKEGRGDLVFCSTEDGVKRAVQNRPAGKLLFVVDGSALKAFRTCLPSRALCLVLDSEDCLPLFASCDDVSYIVAAGGKSTLVAARFFANVHNVPCMLFPVSASLDGAYEKYGDVLLERESGKTPLCDAEVCCDLSLVKETCGQAYMRLLLSRLALFEAKALKSFGLDAGDERAGERLYLNLLPLGSKTLSAEEVVSLNAKARLCEREGMYAGEGEVLARLIGRDGEEQAFFLLSALYSAFFLKGKPRLAVPDYGERAKRAETLYSALKIPTLEEFARRTSAFARTRATLYRELNHFLDGSIHFRNNFYALAGRSVVPPNSAFPLNILPEKSAGLSAVIRDFGLMDWEGSDRSEENLQISV